MASRKLSQGHMVAGKYRLLELLGTGGMGDVYRAEHTFAGRIVAVKLLHADLAEDPEFTRRLFLEAQAVNKIRHPNIVDIVDAGPSEDGPYVVMEYLDGVSLAQALDHCKRVDAATALAVILPVLAALDAAHKNGIVHRDLKPANVFLARAGDDVVVKILDFGIAKVLAGPGAPMPQTSTGIVFGTPDYLSPEQACGDDNIAGRSDVFTVGTLLFELVSGRKPFEASSAVATAYRIVHAPAPPLVSLGILVDPRLQRALDTVLEKSPENRFASAGAVADALAPLVPDATSRKKALRLLLEGHVELASTPIPYARTELEASATPRGPERRPAAGAPPAPIPSRPGAAQQVPRTLLSNDYTPISRAEPRVLPLRDPRPTPGRMPITGPTAPSPTTGTRATSSPWSARALPLSARGRCHTRGALPRAVHHWIERAYGPSGRDEILAMLPPELSETYRTDGFNALVWYDLEAIDTFLEAATQSVMRGEALVWERLAKDNFELDLASILRPTRITEWEVALRRLPGSWGRIFDFGTVHVTEPKGAHATLRIDGFDAASLALRYVVLGTLEGMFATMTNQPKLRVTSGEVSFGRELELDITWHESR